MRTELVLRFDYGVGRALGHAGSSDGALRAIAGPDMVVLRTPVPVRGEDMTHRGRVHGRARARRCPSS